jgi:hypothetical protein
MVSGHPQPVGKVSRAQLTTILVDAARSTRTAELTTGRSATIVAKGKYLSYKATSRVKAGRWVYSQGKDTQIVDTKTLNGYNRINITTGPQAVKNSKVVLKALGKPGAQWLSYKEIPPADDYYEDPSAYALTAKEATNWTWHRASGLTTWVITTRSYTETYVLDSKARVVKEINKDALGTIILNYKYTGVAPISLPGASITVGTDAFWNSMDDYTNLTHAASDLAATANEIAGVNATTTKDLSDAVLSLTIGGVDMNYAGGHATLLSVNSPGLPTLCVGIVSGKAALAPCAV